MTLTVMRASPAQRARTKTEEGLRLEAYKDTVGIWTIGFGHAATNPHPVRGMLAGEFYQGPPKKGVTITPAEADRLFELDMDETERGISAGVSAPLTQGQFDACVDFVHQYGLAKFLNSTLLDRINFNPNSPTVLDEFMRWTRAGGEHQEYVWRRSARRCCVYTGTLIPQKLWRECNKPNGYPFAITADEKYIDYERTPQLAEILKEGERLSKPPVFDPSKPLPTPEPTTTIIVDKIPGVPTEPAEVVFAEVDAIAPPRPQKSTPAPESAGGSLTAEARGAEVSRPPSPPPPPPPAPPPPVAVAPPPAPPPAPKPATTEEVDPKNPAKSGTLWGGLLAALAPQFEEIGNTLLKMGVSMGPPILTLGIIMIVLGRIGAVQPLSVSAPIRSPK